jgi:uncharacterized membrane protein
MRVTVYRRPLGAGGTAPHALPSIHVLLPVHIAAGGLAIILGTIALSARKGGLLHRRIGLAFVYAMLTMGITASIMAFRKNPSDGNVTAGLMTAYFVITALTAVRRASSFTKWLNLGVLVVPIGLAVRMFFGGVVAWQAPGHVLNGVPAFMMFFLGTVLSLAAIGDVRLMRSGPRPGRARLSRHLWRMCFALFIAVGSFFTIRARVAAIFPDFIAASMWRMLPIPAVFATMFYWLWRLRGKRPIPQRG